MKFSTRTNGDGSHTAICRACGETAVLGDDSEIQTSADAETPQEAVRQAAGKLHRAPHVDAAERRRAALVATAADPNTQRLVQKVAEGAVATTPAGQAALFFGKKLQRDPDFRRVSRSLWHSAL